MLKMTTMIMMMDGDDEADVGYDTDSIGDDDYAEDDQMII